MSEPIEFRQDGAFARLTINRPDRGNMLTMAHVEAVTAHVESAGRDPETKAIVIRGAGENFCLGRDPKGAPEKAPRTAVDMRNALTGPILGMYAAVRGAEVPVIAAVQGLANGFGCAVAAVCDVTIAADDAKFALPEMKADLPPTLAMCAHIDRTMPKSIAWLVYSTEQVDAETARALGFVSQVVPAAALDDGLESLLETLNARSREALITCKTFLSNARLMETERASDYAGNLLAVVMSSK